MGLLALAIIAGAGFGASHLSGGTVGAPLVPEGATIGSADRLDFAQLTLSFDAPFEQINITPWGPITRKGNEPGWIAHTPWAGDFGGAAFTDPRAGFPFTVQDGALKIEVLRDEAGTWRSGLIASDDLDGTGFAQRGGYFEMRARLPSGPGLWPAFWLIGRDRALATAEIDVLEYYGDRPEGYSSVVHVWHRGGARAGAHDTAFRRIEVFDDSRPQDWHLYGVMVDDEWLRFYFDRALVWKTPTLPHHRQPLYMLVNLALVNGESRHDAPDPSAMIVDYVRAYQRAGD